MGRIGERVAVAAGREVDFRCWSRLAEEDAPVYGIIVGCIISIDLELAGEAFARK